MSLLRVYFNAPPDPERSLPWVLVGEDGALLKEGNATLAQLPEADGREAVLSVALAPIAALNLPPMNSARLDGAVRLALEDRLVTPLNSLYLLNRMSPVTGTVLTRWAELSLLDILRDTGFTRAISEADLIQCEENTWQCCVAPDGQGFVRRSDGSTVALHLSPNAALPAELTLALRQADPKPATIKLFTPTATAISFAWQRQNNAVRWLPQSTWRWQSATPALFAEAVDLMPPKPQAGFKMTANLARWKLAGAIAAAALALHIAATGIAWGTSQWQSWQIERGWKALAQSAGVTPATNLVTTQRDLNRAYARLRHQGGLDAPTDALPLLARLSEAVARLPQGAVRRMQYADASWTIECQTLTAEQQKNLTTALHQVGFSTFGGVTKTGYNVRVELELVSP